LVIFVPLWFVWIALAPVDEEEPGPDHFVFLDRCDRRVRLKPAARSEFNFDSP
jgi:hypothetical protein